VVVVDDLSTGRFDNIAHLTKNDRFTFAIESITNEVVMDRLVSECDVIFHLAAAVGVDLIVRDPVRVIKTNILGTEAVLKMSSRYRKKVLIASTSEIYGKNSQVPFHEDDDRLLGPTTKARWSYSASKAVDEFLGLAYHRHAELPVVIFRLFNTVGPNQSGQYGMVVPRFVEQALRGDPLTVYDDGLQSRCFCDVADAVRAIIDLSESPEAVGQVFNVGSTEEVTILDLARKVLDSVNRASDKGQELSGESERIVFVPYVEAYETGFEDMRRRVPDISKVKKAVGWEPRIGLEETLRRIVKSHSPSGAGNTGPEGGR
jgi:UDP-glucose 4-epimerase